MSIISLYCAPDVRYLMDWDTHRKFHNDERCSYGIQMWNYYMKGICRDLFKILPEYFASDIFGEILVNSMKLWNETYSNIFPSTKKKVAQYKSDITFLVMYSRSYRGVIDSKTEKQVNRECLRVLVFMALICAPIDVLKSFLESYQRKEGSLQCAKFAVIFQQNKVEKYIKGIPVVVWNSPKFNPMFDLNPLKEFNRIGNAGKVNNELEFSEIKNVSFDFVMLLHGYYICGISLRNMSNRIQLRCEYNDQDYPPPPDEEKILREDVKGILAALLQ
ncbi:hypothetical protein C9374_011377 [Naegleria lovaniensis]|uniref:Uncharacterized protein n=1 Tax=Naegleria lovaniensis TaxID=51637 RepID=A0AA88H465_NAELO|nr:uncharacterized protein C9374_011377 [Naegleria lovaniensis]KAG2392652.1 hypothetical protein C9374_011377 [Naegleria lovaniensis]